MSNVGFIWKDWVSLSEITVNLRVREDIVTFWYLVFKTVWDIWRITLH